MSDTSNKSANVAYQTVRGSSGGSYNDDKFSALKMPNLSGKRFLDLGCNAGFYCAKASEQGASRVFGVDTDPAVVKIARERNPNAEFLDTGWDRFPEGEFDVVICLSAIHYAKDPIELVNNIRACLAPDGVLILEGGLVDADAELKTDTLIPVWREVGDRCRHLSGGFLANHLLRSFEWCSVGSSEPRGGDPVSRFVIHANPGDEQSNSDIYRLDLDEFAKCMLLSADSISSSQRSYSLLADMSRSEDITSCALEAVLANEDNFQAFMDDILFTLGRRRPMKVEVSTAASLLDRVLSVLREENINV